MISDAFVCLDYGATPTTQDDGQGGTIAVYPPLAGLYAITDQATFARSADVLTPYRVSLVPAQRILGGDVAETPTLTVTLHFADQAEYDAVAGPVNALPPPDPPAPVTRRSVFAYRFKAALRQFPSLAPADGRTLRDDVDAEVAALGGQLLDRWAGAPEFYRDDADLNDLANAMAGSVDQGQALLTAIFDAADQVP